MYKYDVKIGNTKKIVNGGGQPLLNKNIISIIFLMFLMFSCCDVKAEDYTINEEGKGEGYETSPCKSGDFACVSFEYYQVKVKCDRLSIENKGTLNSETLNCKDFYKCNYSDAISPRYKENPIETFVNDSGKNIQNAVNNDCKIYYCPVVSYIDKDGYYAKKSTYLMAKYITDNNKFPIWEERSALLKTLEDYAYTPGVNNQCAIVSAKDIVPNKVKLIKLDKDNTEIKLGGAEFEIYEGRGCNSWSKKIGTYTTATWGDNSGTVEIEDLKFGKTYSIKETITPSNPSNSLNGSLAAGGMPIGDYASNKNNLGCIVPSFEIGEASSGENYEYDGKATLKIYNSKSGNYKIEKYKNVYKNGKIVEELLTDIPVKFNIYTDSSCTNNRIPYVGTYSSSGDGIVRRRDYDYINEIVRLGYKCEERSEGFSYLYNQYYYCYKELGFVTTSGGSVQFGDDLPNGQYYIKEVYSGDIAEEYEENKECKKLQSPNGNIIQTTKIINNHKTILKIIKRGSDNKYLKDAEFNVYNSADCSGSSIESVKTDKNGEAIVDVKTAGWYSIKETSAPEGYIKSDKCYSVYVNEMSTKEITVTNSEKPIIKKVDKYDGKEINKDVTFEIYDDSTCDTAYDLYDILSDEDIAKIEQDIDNNRLDYLDIQNILEEPNEYITGGSNYRYGYYECEYNSSASGKFVCKKKSIKEITFKGHFNFSDLGTGYSDQKTYYIKEIKAPDGYKFKENDDDEAPCLSIKHGDTREVENWTSCSIEFNKNMSMEERIRLYIKYNNSDNSIPVDIQCKNCNGLLDLSITSGSEACRNYSCSGSNDSKCLSGSYGNRTYTKADGSQSSSFSENNIACYSDTFQTTDGKGIAYCLPTFTLTNNLGKTVFSTKSGRMPIQILDKANAVATTGTFKQQCYIYYDGNESVTGMPRPTYSDYIGDIKLNNDNLNGEDRKTEEKPTGDFKGHWYSYTETVKYYLNPVYSKNGSGDISKTSGSLYKQIGYGVVSKFKDDSEYIIPFSVKIGSKFPYLKDKIYNPTSDKCIVNPDQEIIITDPDPKKPDEINVEFRIIDTTNPFPGINGIGRKVGTNWSYNGDNTAVNQTVQSVMDRNNSYNKNKQTAKYKVTLTPDLIKEIREYNKSNKYDDYTLKCTNGENCTSTFLEKFSIHKNF